MDVCNVAPADDAAFLLGLERQSEIQHNLHLILAEMAQVCGNGKMNFYGPEVFDRLIQEYEVHGESCLTSSRRQFVVRISRIITRLRECGVDLLPHQPEIASLDYGEWVRIVRTHLYPQSEVLRAGRVMSSHVPQRYVGSPYDDYRLPHRRPFDRVDRCRPLKLNPSLLPLVAEQLPELRVADFALDTRSFLAKFFSNDSSSESVIRPHDPRYGAELEKLFPRLADVFWNSSAREGRELRRDAAFLGLLPPAPADRDINFRRKPEMTEDGFFDALRGLRHDHDQMDRALLDLQESLSESSQNPNPMRVYDAAVSTRVRLDQGWFHRDRGIPRSNALSN